MIVVDNFGITATRGICGKCHCGKCHCGKCHCGKCHCGKCHCGKCHCGKCRCGNCHSSFIYFCLHSVGITLHGDKKLNFIVVCLQLHINRSRQQHLKESKIEVTTPANYRSFLLTWYCHVYLKEAEQQRMEKEICGVWWWTAEVLQ